MTHKIFQNAKAEEFNEEQAPDWLTSRNTVPGSTMDDRWFWQEHVTKLQVGEQIETDFRIITRIMLNV